MTYALVVSAALGAILLFLLAVASANSSLFAQHYPLLLILNGVIAVALAVLVAYQLWRLRRALRAKVFGSRLTLRLLLLFVAMAIAPGVLVYTVSLQFLAKSIESWFDVRVDNALESGLALGRDALDAMLEELRGKARVMALELGDLPPTQQSGALNRLREQAGVDDAMLVGTGGAVIAGASREVAKLVPEAPPAVVLRQVRSGRPYAAIDALGDRGLVLRVVVPIGGTAIADETRILQLTHAVPPSLAEKAEAVQSVYRDYRELSLLRAGLKRIYILTLTLTLLLALFSAIALAFILSRRLSEPLAELAESTLAVARGDFSHRPRVTSRDELGILTRSFNSMIGQLDDARAAAEANREQVESARAHLENILANLSAGVLTFDESLRLQVANHGAAAILGEDVLACIGGPLGGSAALDTLAEAIREGFGQEHAPGTWQRELDIEGRGITILVRGSSLPGGGGYVVVFDDVTQLIAAQRATAWGEVARRLAHEIKNPLTPIQLSAQRILKKWREGDPEVGAVIEECAETITQHVDGLKTLVNEFSRFARMPPVQPLPTQLDRVIHSALVLYEGLNQELVLTRRVAGDIPTLSLDPEQIKRVLINLVDNAIQCQGGIGKVTVEASYDTRLQAARIVVGDEGPGIPPEDRDKMFVPYFSTRPGGTGLGLAIVHRIVSDHNGAIRIEENLPRGTRFVVELPA